VLEVHTGWDMNEEVSAELGKRLKGAALVLGVGNPLRGDDGAGCRVAEGLKAAGHLEAIDCRDTPEKYTKDIVEKRPDTILIVDVADFEGSPGDVKIFEIDEIIETGFSTHDMAIKLLAKYVKGHVEAEVFLLGIKAQVTGFNAPMSAPVQKSVEEIVEFLSKIG